MVDVLSKTQSHIRYILEAEMTIEGSENRTNRKKKNFIEDLRDLIALLEENPINDIQEVIIASEFIEKVKDLDEQFRENRTNMDDFKTECDLGDDYGNFNIKERLLEIKLDLLSQKERLTDQKHDQKEAEKSKTATYYTAGLGPWNNSCARWMDRMSLGLLRRFLTA